MYASMSMSDTSSLSPVSRSATVASSWAGDGRFGNRSYGDEGDNKRLVMEGAVSVDATDARWDAFDETSDGHIDDHDGMGERGARPALRAGVVAAAAAVAVGTGVVAADTDAAGESD